VDPTGQSLLKLLFNEGENICVSHNEYGYHSVPLEEVLSKESITLIPTEESCKKRKIEFCPENYDHVRTDNLIMVALNPIRGYRVDANVTSIRSFLIELDVGSIKDQQGTISHLKMPFSAQVFSGNKSIHTVITLSEDLQDEKTYRLIAEWIFRIITLADSSCKNPSRSVRIPGSHRNNGKKQRLIRIKERVTPKELMDWLNKYEHLRPKAREKKVVAPGQADFSRLSTWARIQLTKGIDFAKRGRNQTFFGLAYDLALAGFTEENAIEMLTERFTEEHDFKEKELLTTIGSAFKKVSKG
jgi:hypothetical protein